MRAYFWIEHEDADTGIAVVADNMKEAKTLAYSWHGQNIGHNEEFIDQKINWIKKAKVEGLSKGVIEDYVDGLKRNCYSYIIANCPVCKSMDCMVYYNEETDKVGCGSCLV